MVVCPRCSKENQDHYKFCLGCGGELPKDAQHQPKSFTAPTPPAGFPVVGGGRPAPAPVGAAPPPAPAPAPVAPAGSAASSKCPKCGTDVPPSFKFCGTCGTPMGASAPAAAPAPAPQPHAPTSRGRLVVIRADGTEGDVFPLHDGATVVGRQAGGPFGQDAYLSPKHATFTIAGGALRVRDESSLNGVYVKLTPNAPVPLTDGTVFRIGQEILRFEALRPKPAVKGVEPMGSPDPGCLGRIVLVVGRETTGNAHCVPASGLHLGRERGDVIFPEDGYVSGLHCRIAGEPGRVTLTDVGSSNGSFLRLRGETPVASGALLLMGQQLFRAEY